MGEEIKCVVPSKNEVSSSSVSSDFPVVDNRHCSPDDLIFSLFDSDGAGNGGVRPKVAHPSAKKC